MGEKDRNMPRISNTTQKIHLNESHKRLKNKQMVNKIHETPKENGQNSERESNGKWRSCRQNIMISCAFILIDARKSAIYFMKSTEGFMTLRYFMKILHNKFK